MTGAWDDPAVQAAVRAAVRETTYDEAEGGAVVDAAVKQLRAEFGDPFTIWGREGEWAWELMVQNFCHIGWGPPPAER